MINVRVVVKPSEADGKVLVIVELSLMEYFEARRGADIMYGCTSGRVASPLARFIGESLTYLRGIRKCGSL